MFQNTVQSPNGATHTLEILIMWLVAGLLGLLIGYVIWHLRPREYLSLKKQIRDLAARLRELEGEKGRLQMSNEKLSAELAEWKAKHQALLGQLDEREALLKQKQEALDAITNAADDLTAIDGRFPRYPFAAGRVKFKQLLKLYIQSRGFSIWAIKLIFAYILNRNSTCR